MSEIIWNVVDGATIIIERKKNNEFYVSTKGFSMSPATVEIRKGESLTITIPPCLQPHEEQLNTGVDNGLWGILKYEAID